MIALITGYTGTIRSGLIHRLLKPVDILVGLGSNHDCGKPNLEEAGQSRGFNHASYTHVREGANDGELVADVFHPGEPLNRPGFFYFAFRG